MTSPRQRRLQGFVKADRDRTGIPNDWFRTTPFIRYDPVTGEILEKGTESIAGLKHMSDVSGYHYLPVAGDFNLHYVDTVKMRRRCKSICPAVLDGLVLRALPRPCRIEISEPATGTEVYELSDPEIALAFDHPGTYTVRVLAVPHLPGEFTVVVP